jgi:hypothetical protein
VRSAECGVRQASLMVLFIRHSAFRTPKLINARVTTADAEQTTVAAFLPWRGS